VANVASIAMIREMPIPSYWTDKSNPWLTWLAVRANWKTKRVRIEAGDVVKIVSYDWFEKHCNRLNIIVEDYR
jgi:hypothetical protein